MNDLNEKQKSVVEILYNKYKSDTVTRTQINNLVADKTIPNPNWLKTDEYKVSRGLYKLPLNGKEKKTQKGNSYAILKLTDLSSVFELFIFSDNFS